jgi:hypothetical protein
MKSISARIAEELGVRENQVTATIELLDGGATVPFVARYRKEVTDGLDDIQLRTLDERLRYMRELDDRRKAILDSIDSQGKLDAPLRKLIEDADSKARLEDIYLPYKPKRRTKVSKPSKPRSTARVPFSPSVSRKTPNCLAICAKPSGTKACSSRKSARARKPTAPSSPIIST